MAADIPVQNAAEGCWQQLQQLSAFADKRSAQCIQRGVLGPARTNCRGGQRKLAVHTILQHLLGFFHDSSMLAHNGQEQVMQLVISWGAGVKGKRW